MATSPRSTIEERKGNIGSDAPHACMAEGTSAQTDRLPGARPHGASPGGSAEAGAAFTAKILDRGLYPEFAAGLTIPLIDDQIPIVVTNIYDHLRFLNELLDSSIDVIGKTSQLKRGYPFLTNRVISENGGFESTVTKLRIWEVARLKRARRHKVLI